MIQRRKNRIAQAFGALRDSVMGTAHEAKENLC